MVFCVLLFEKKKPNENVWINFHLIQNESQSGVVLKKISLPWLTESRTRQNFLFRCCCWMFMMNSMNGNDDEYISSDLFLFWVVCFPMYELYKTMRENILIEDRKIWHRHNVRNLFKIQYVCHVACTLFGLDIWQIYKKHKVNHKYENSRYRVFFLSLSSFCCFFFLLHHLLSCDFVLFLLFFHVFLATGVRFWHFAFRWHF